MKKTVKILFMLFVFGLFFVSDVYYGISMLKGQLNILFQTQPIEALLSDKSVADSVKHKLRLVKEVREFAVNSLGLNSTNSYSTVFDQQGHPSIWNVSASQPFKLEAYEWYFPILGTVPYKGFFVEEYAMEEYHKLTNMGLDVRVRDASAWSTLGIMNDPILTNFLGNSEGEIAELIIHELTHGTIWVNGGVELNENLATFVGEHGAEEFLKYFYGEDAKQLKNYKNLNEGYLTYAGHILRGANYLESVYQRVENKPIEYKITEKNKAIDEIIKSLDTLNFQDPAWKGVSERLKADRPNNAYFMSFKRYRAKQSLFEDEFINTFDGKIALYLTYLKSEYEN